MRLTARETAAIRAAAVRVFGPDVVVRLFGSRLDDSRRGGDIDLLVELPATPAPLAAGAFRRLLDRDVGEREYDILLSVTGNPLSPVERKAMREGIRL